ncbi:hypothetical protein BDZ90DRAFT_229428 [Jaminaea rosea]|uniref:Dolichyl-diphosphooligosaccharide-protein glycosyltransferase subunit OST5 n=1 Tax=Jaminaea rosea TaxID=1569628 RepID=A0A316V2J4_9BASI|nr:hypothetical protein BDZ90DRAFT_229428 [Jaminaea rosea]PWN30403.1 hypothetical protein BDZ90DRAFT_229428 [Jaminaea rosea]
MSFSQSYKAAASLHSTSPPIRPSVPVHAMPTVALVLLLATFFGAFFFTTLPKRGALPSELAVAIATSICAGGGVVALFNAVGVYV